MLTANSGQSFKGGSLCGWVQPFHLTTCRGKAARHKKMSRLTSFLSHLISPEALRQDPIEDVIGNTGEGAVDHFRRASLGDAFSDRSAVGTVGEREELSVHRSSHLRGPNRCELWFMHLSPHEHSRAPERFFAEAAWLYKHRVKPSYQTPLPIPLAAWKPAWSLLQVELAHCFVTPIQKQRRQPSGLASDRWKKPGLHSSHKVPATLF